MIMQRLDARSGRGLHHFRWAAAISSFLVFPFMMLEFVNRGPFTELVQSFPIPLFATMWLLGFAFVSILSRMVRGEPTRLTFVPALAARLLGVIVLTFIAYAWVAIVADQMPCFLGVPNCD